MALPRIAQSLLASDFVEEPYWWIAASPSTPEALEGSVDGRSVDVAIVGSGLTGTIAALELARGGASVIVIDSRKVGAGASRMNAGFVSRKLQVPIGTLEKRKGSDYARAVYAESNTAMESVGNMVRREGIDCFYQVCGRYYTVTSLGHKKSIIKNLENLKRIAGFEYQLLDQRQMTYEVNTNAYVGGIVIPGLGSIHPGLYHAGLVRAAIEAGGFFQQNTEVLAVESRGATKRVVTSKGVLNAGQVIVATNGYTTRNFRWLSRRLVPFRGFMMATDILPKGTIDSLLPNRRVYSDTLMDLTFFRAAPDSERILFGAMTGTNSATARPLLGALHQRMVSLFPILKDVKISRCWTGNCAATFDMMPHIGTKDGIHFAGGYNYSGLPFSTYFGQKLAARILGKTDTSTLFDAMKFPGLPFYNGSPLLASLSARYFSWQDRRIARSG